jgi:adenylate kinase
MDIVVFGIQGSGKGTQAKKLAADGNFDIFEAGGELRKIAASGSDLGNTVKSYIDIGKLVPFEIIMRVVSAAVASRPKDQKILFDGIPRDGDQQKEFDAIMKKQGRNFRAIHLKLDPEEGVRRILGRAKIEGRADDADEHIIRRRMATFMEKTLPVIAAYTAQGMMTEIDGMKSVEEVYAEMKSAVRA